jgi:uncharacterized protein
LSTSKNLARELGELAQKAGLGGVAGSSRSGDAPPGKPDDLGFMGDEDGGDKAEANVIRTHGSGSRNVDPDMASIALGVEVQDKTLEGARHGAADAAQAFLAAVQALAIRGLVLQTRRVSLSPVYSDEGSFRTTRTPTIVGYRAVGGVSATLRGMSSDQLATLASKIVDTAAHHGANRIDGIAFELEHPEVPAREALALAVKDARANAEAIAAAAGTSLGALHSICARPAHMGGFRSLGFMPAVAQAMSSKGGAETPIEAGEILVHRAVVGRWYFASGDGGDGGG